MDFDIFLSLSARSVQKVLRNIDRETVELALQNTDGIMKGKFFGVMSSRAAQLMQDQMSKLEAVDEKAIESARQKMLQELHALIENGEITEMDTNDYEDNINSNGDIKQFSDFSEKTMLIFENIPSFRFLTRTQKHRIFRIPSVLCLLARKSRREGILALEEGIDDLVGEVDKRDEWFLMNFMRMVLDFTEEDKADLSVTFKNLVTASGGSKLSILCHQMIAAGCTGILEGCHEKTILYHLASFLGNKWQDEFFTSPEMHYILTQINCPHSIIINDGNDFLYPEADADCSSHPLALIFEYSDSAIQKILREVSTKDLCLAFKDARAKIRNAFLKNMSERARYFLKMKLDDETEPYNRQKILEAQQRLGHVIKRLEDVGEIKRKHE